jgi:hypothetical protein
MTTYSTARALRTHAAMLRLLGSPEEADRLNTEEVMARAIRASLDRLLGLAD